MKIIRLSGGIGNQLFQYALYLVLENNGDIVKLDKINLERNPVHGDYQLGKIFGINPNFATEDEIDILLPKNNAFIQKLKNRFKLFGPNHYVYEPLKWNSKVFELINNKYIQGYWQSEKYFYKISNLVRNKLKFRKECIDDNNIEFAKELSSKNIVSIHVRGGDYINHNLYDNICTKEYYLNAVEKIGNLCKVDDFVIFTNDIKYCNEIFTKNKYVA